VVQPGTSALFLIVEQMTTDKAMTALSQFGGNVINTSLSAEAEQQIQDPTSTATPDQSRPGGRRADA